MYTAKNVQDNTWIIYVSSSYVDTKLGSLAVYVVDRTLYSTAVVYILNNVCVPTVVLIDAELEPPAVHMVAERLDAAGEPVRVREWRIITCACSRDQSVQPLKPVLKCAYRHTGSPVRIHVRPLEIGFHIRIPVRQLEPFLTYVY